MLIVGLIAGAAVGAVCVWLWARGEIARREAKLRTDEQWEEHLKAVTADALATRLDQKGLTVILDDRQKVSPGVKFKDAELIGVPTIVTVGRGLADGVVEVKDRRTGEREDLALDEVVQHLADLVAAG